MHPSPARYHAAMAMTTSDVIGAVRTIEKFTGASLTGRIADLEHAIQNCDGQACRAHGMSAGVTSELLAAGYVLKRAAGQVNVLIHAVAVMLLVPKIVQPG